MNFVCISPNYPESYWLFCRGLKKYGATVLAIVDQPYDSLRPELKEFCDECYVVSSFHDYDEMVRACGYFTFKYGKIDWIESNNEAWLDLDAALRDDFHVTTGFDLKTIMEYQSKSGMKKYYEKAKVPTARYELVSSYQDAAEFVKKVGYPVILKPDHGVGASFTYRINNQQDLEEVYQETRDYQMIIEEYIDGDIITLDGIADENSKIRYLSSFEYVGNPMESVLHKEELGIFTAFKIPKKYQQIAQNVISAFQVKNRFFHGEYFRLKRAKKGLGKKGDLIGLELNFRPPGGFVPDMMNYARNVDVFDIWAQVLLTQQADYPDGHIYSSVFAGRRAEQNYTYTAQEIQEEFQQEWIDTIYLPAAYAAAMGDEAIVARFTDIKRRDEFFEMSFHIQEDEND